MVEKLDDISEQLKELKEILLAVLEELHAAVINKINDLEKQKIK